MATSFSIILMVSAWFAQGNALPSASPSDVGLSAEKLAVVDKAMQTYVDKGKIAGILTLVARNGRVAHVGQH